MLNLSMLEPFSNRFALHKGWFAASGFKGSRNSSLVRSARGQDPAGVKPRITLLQPSTLSLRGLGDLASINTKRIQSQVDLRFSLHCSSAALPSSFSVSQNNKLHGSPPFMLMAGEGFQTSIGMFWLLGRSTDSTTGDPTGQARVSPDPHCTLSLFFFPPGG